MNRLIILFRQGIRACRARVAPTRPPPLRPPYDFNSPSLNSASTPSPNSGRYFSGGGGNGAARRIARITESSNAGSRELCVSLDAGQITVGANRKMHAGGQVSAPADVIPRLLNPDPVPSDSRAEIAGPVESPCCPFRSRRHSPRPRARRWRPPAHRPPDRARGVFSAAARSSARCSLSRFCRKAASCSLTPGVGSARAIATSFGLGRECAPCFGTGVGVGSGRRWCGVGVGRGVRLCVGRGRGVGFGVGARVGSGVGSSVGSAVGSGVGSTVGSGVGGGVGSGVGSACSPC